MALDYQEIQRRLDTVQNYPPRNHDNEAYHPGYLLDKFLVIGDKLTGVEPGALVVFIEDIINMNLKVFNGIENKTSIEKRIYDDKKFRNKVAVEIYNQFKNQHDEHKPPVFLIKQDYQDSSNKVAPPPSRLKKTNAVSKLPNFFHKPASKIYYMVRKTDRAIENQNALLEVAANNVAKNYGMPCQEQFILIGKYNDGYPKIMTIAQWEYKLISLKGFLQGASKKKPYHNYIVQAERDQNTKKPIMDESGKLKFITSDNKFIVDTDIQCLGSDFAIALLMGDRDYFGSRLQNKVAISENGNLKLYGFDFGHAFRKNPYIKKFDHNFNFENTKETLSSFKNLSVFFDRSMSEKMLGIFIIYQGMSEHSKKLIFKKSERENIEKAINHYKEKYPIFSERFDKINPGVIKRSFDKQIEICNQEIEKNSSKEITQYYTAYRNNLQEALTTAIENEHILMGLFREKMELSPDEVNLMDNLNKYCANSLTHYSPDNKVKLNYPAYSERNKHFYDWKISEKNDQQVTLVSQHSKKNVPEMLKIMLKNMKIDNPKIIEKNGQISISMTPDAFQHLQKHFNTNELKKCRQDYRDASQNLQEDQALEHNSHHRRIIRR